MDNAKNYEDRKSMVMEGMYKGMAGKLDEVRQTVSKELQFNSAQQASAYESLAGSFKQGFDAILAEFKYLSQQNSAIYDYNQKERNEVRDTLLEAVQACNERMAAMEADFEKRLEALKEELQAMQTAPAAAPAETAAEEPAAVKAAAEEPAEAETRGTAENTASAASDTSDVMLSDENFDYDVLAEKIASIMPETDYDALVDKIVTAMPVADADTVAGAVVSMIPQVDELAIADKVAEAIPLVDYDLIAERVASVMEREFDLTVDEGGIEKIAAAVASELDYDRLADAVAERLRATGMPSSVVAVPMPVPAAEEPKARETEDVQEEEPEEEVSEDADEELAIAAPAVRTAAPAVRAVVPVTDDPALMTRYKRSFKAKIIESTEEIKNYYFDLRNAMLSFTKVSSQISWSNDRFTYAGDTVAKIGVRGKTLCLYVALNPDEFPSSVYHQKFAGDTKMYEKTPMMIKIKSGVAVKRGIRLIEMLMENLGAVKDENFVPADYADEFAFRSEEQLLAEGLIKTAIVEKSDLDF